MCCINVFKIYISVKHNYLLSIMHKATCFDSRSHHKAILWTISKIYQVTRALLLDISLTWSNDDDDSLSGNMSLNE